MKTCTKCKKEYPENGFYQTVIRGVLRINSWCKKCLAQCNNERARRLRKEDKLKSRREHLKQKYGMTIEDFDAMLDAQAGGCAVCGSTLKLNVDHDHETGAVRGILCERCNHALGHARDEPLILRGLAAYLESAGA